MPTAQFITGLVDSGKYMVSSPYNAGKSRGECKMHGFIVCTYIYLLSSTLSDHIMSYVENQNRNHLVSLYKTAQPLVKLIDRKVGK